MTERPKSSREPAGATEPIVFVIDDDASMRRALTNLFQSVGGGRGVRFGVRNAAKQASGCRQLPGPRHPIARIERTRLSNRTGQGEHSHSNHLHDRPWRYSDDREGHEGRRGGFPDQAVSRPGHAGRRGDGDRTGSEEA